MASATSWTFERSALIACERLHDVCDITALIFGSSTPLLKSVISCTAVALPLLCLDVGNDSDADLSPHDDNLEKLPLVSLFEDEALYFVKVVRDQKRKKRIV